MSHLGLKPIVDESAIDAIFAPLNQSHLPGAAVGIAVDGVPVYRKGFGLATLELPVTLSTGIRMRIQSTSKHFACLAYLLLCEDGKASLEDPVGRYLPGLHPAIAKVTVRQLMAHTGGVPDVCAIRYLFSGMSCEVPTEELVALYRDLDTPLFEPDTAWAYSNGGYALLCVVIERITGASLEEVLAERIFAPAGMHDTMMRRYSNDLIPNSVTNHTRTAGGAFVRAYPFGSSAGNGGVCSTVDDMLRWMKHMDAPTVGSGETWKQLATPQRLANGTSTGYGLGLMTGEYRGACTLFHGGNQNGCNSQMLKVPEARLDIEVMLNRDDISGWTLVYKILDACLQGLAPRAPAPTTRPLTGVFRSASSGRVIELGAIHRDAPSALSAVLPEGAQTAALDGMDLHVEPNGTGALRPVAMQNPWKWSVRPAGDGLVPSLLVLDYFGNRDELIAMHQPARLDRSVEGRFHSDATGTEALIASHGEDARMETNGHFGSAGFGLSALSDGVWRARSDLMQGAFGGILTFDGDGFHFSTPQVGALRFRRLA